MFVYKTVQRILYFSCLILIAPTIVTFVFDTDLIVKATIKEQTYLIPKLKFEFVLNYLIEIFLIKSLLYALIVVYKQNYKLLYICACLMTINSVALIIFIEVDAVFGQFRALFAIIITLYCARFARMVQVRDRDKPIRVYNGKINF